MQSRPHDAINVWSGQAQSSPRSIGRSYFGDSGPHKGSGKRLGGMVDELRRTAASGASARTRVDVLPSGLAIRYFRHGLLTGIGLDRLRDGAPRRWPDDGAES